MSQNFTKKELRQLLILVNNDLNHCEIYGDFDFTKQLLNKIRVLIYRYDEESEISSEEKNKQDYENTRIKER